MVVTCILSSEFEPHLLGKRKTLVEELQIISEQMRKVGKEDVFEFDFGLISRDKRKMQITSTNFKQNWIKLLRQLPYVALVALILITIIFILGFLAPNSTWIKIFAGGSVVPLALLLGSIWGLLSLPKKMVLKNGFIFLAGITSRKANFSFDEIIAFTNEERIIFYFRRKGRFVSNSFILFTKESKYNQELVSFLKEYALKCTDVKFSNNL